VYLTLFALLSVVGAWAAWRTHPLYSTQATLRFVAIVGLAIAAVIAAIAGVVKLTENSSPAVVGLSMFGVVLFGTLSLIWIIVALSSAHAPKLSANLEAVRVHRAKLLGWMRNLAYVLLAFGIAALLLPGDLKIVAGVFAAMTAFVGIVMLFAGYIAARGMDLALTSIEADPWLHWRYTPEEWKAWSDAETARLVATPPHWIWRRDWRRLIVPGVAIIGGVYLFDPGSWLWKSAYLGGLFALGFIMVELSNQYAKGGARRLHTSLMRATPETYFGASGVFADGVFTQWMTISKYLTEASIDERPPQSLTLRFEEIPPGPNPPFPVYVNVLIPPGSDGDLARLQERLSATCPSAGIALRPPLPSGTPAVSA
jgi:hypothetical protein